MIGEVLERMEKYLQKVPNSRPMDQDQEISLISQELSSDVLGLKVPAINKIVKVVYY